jgi:probable phosphoglycerate mutase
MSKTTSIHLVRHGATDAIGRTFTGRRPGVPLNREGREQAERLAARFQNLDIRSVFSSPAERALQTAQSIASAARVTVEQRCAFHEIDIGSWGGATFEDLNLDEEFRLFNSVRSLTRPPSGELMLEVQNRAVGELLKIAQQYAGSAVVVVSHSDVIRSALAYFLGLPLDLAHRLVIGLASVSLIQLSRENIQVVQING